jgi:VWFA-related protein
MKTRQWIKCLSLFLLFPTVALGWPQEPAVKLETRMVLVDAIVLSKRTNTIVGDLTREDFSVRENGQPQEITHFSREELPLSVLLLVDVSGSVQPVIDEIQRAALDALALLKPEDKVGLMIFGHKPKLITDLTQDRAVIANELEDIWNDAVDVGMATFMNLAIYEAARHLRKRTEPNERRAIVMITDDMDTGRFGAGPPREAVLRELYEGGTTLCGVVVGANKKAMTAISIGTTAAITAASPIAGGLLIAMRLMHRLSPTRGSAKLYAEKTGGIAVNTKLDEVATAFAEMMTLLRTRYTLGYAPPDSPADARFREIKLTLSPRVKKEKGEVQVLARRGYYVRAPLRLVPDGKLRTVVR